jgi:hypothetical protein
LNEVRASGEFHISWSGSAGLRRPQTSDNCHKCDSRWWSYPHPCSLWSRSKFFLFILVSDAATV